MNKTEWISITARIRRKLYLGKKVNQFQVLLFYNLIFLAFAQTLVSIYYTQ